MSRSTDIPETGTVTRLLREVRDGDRAAFNQLLPLVYDVLKHISRRQLRQRGQTFSTTDLVHEAYLKMARQAPIDWKDRAHFYGVAARAMRQILIDYARRQQADKRGGGQHPLTLGSQHLTYEVQIDELLALDEALDRLDALNERLRKVVEYKFFGGMTEEEVADVLGVSLRTVERDWMKARLFLRQALNSAPGG